jgi:hypothetical protein
VVLPRNARLAAVFALTAACGRLGFDPIDAAETMDAPGIDVPERDAPVADAPDAPVADAPDAGCGMAVDPCTTVPRLPDPPVLDGRLDPCLVPSPITPVAWTDTGVPNVTARAAVAWRADLLYVYIEVDDPALHPAGMTDDAYCGDGVEVYVDDDGTFAAAPDYDVPGTSQLIVAAPVNESSVSTQASRWAAGAGELPWPGRRMVMRGRPGGYALEVFVDANALGLSSWSLAAGDRVGFDLSINVSTADGTPTGDPADCGSRLGQFFLAATPDPTPCGGLPFCDARVFCRPTLAP